MYFSVRVGVAAYRSAPRKFFDLFNMSVTFKLPLFRSVERSIALD